jgi:hypothetical protein
MILLAALICFPQKALESLGQTGGWGKGVAGEKGTKEVF